MIDTLMGIQTHRIPHLPAVVAHYRGHITRADLERMYADTARLLADVDGCYYRISDIRGSDTDFREFMGMLVSVRDNGPFRTGDPKLQVIFVGTNKWVVNMQSVMARKGAIPLMVETLEEAIDFIEAQCNNTHRWGT
jgi:hypothetical protein